MTEAIAYLLVFVAFILASFGLAFLAALSTRWLFKNPQRWLVFAMLLFSVVSLGGGDTTDGSSMKQLTWGALFAYAGFVVFRITEGRLEWPKKEIPWSMFLLIGFLAISIAWSPSFIVSLKRVIQIIGILLISVVIGRNSLSGKGIREQLLVPACGFLSLGLLFAFAAPSHSFDQDHALRAFSNHKNTWGQFSLLTCLTLLYCLMVEARHRLLMVGLLCAAILSLALSRSTTSLLAFIAVTAITMTIKVFFHYQTYGKILVLMLSISLVIATLAFTILNGKLPFSALVDSVFIVTEKSQTLTGRTFLWQLMQVEIEQHPWLGIGYGGFWLVKDTAVLGRLNWGPPTQAHNGYLDVLNETGMVGMSLLFCLLFVHLKKIIGLARSGFTVDVAFHASIFCAALIINYTESSFLRTTHIWWIILCSSIIEVHMKTPRLLQLSEEASTCGSHETNHLDVIARRSVG